MRKAFSALGMLLTILIGNMIAPIPAFAVQPGSVTAVFNNVPGNPNFTVHANGTGWALGDITVTHKLYISTSENGPWVLIDTQTHTCQDSTHCSTVTTYSHCYNPGAWYKLKATASGRGGAAENNPSTKIKRVYGPLPPTLIAARYSPYCTDVIIPI